MNKCRMINHVSSYLDNQLSAREKKRFEAHLAGCAACTRELAQLKLLAERMSSWKAPEPQDNFERGVKDSIVAHELERGQSTMKNKTVAILIPSGVIAGLLLFVVMGRVFLQYDKTMKFTNMRNDALMSQEQDWKKTNTEDSYLSNKVKSARDSGLGGAGGKGDSGGLRKEISAGFYDGNVPAAAGYAVNGKIMEGTNAVHEFDPQIPLRDLSGQTVRGREYAQGQIVPLESGSGPVIVIQPTLPATGVGDKIIRTAEVRLEVQDGKEAYKKASRICQELGGYLAASNFFRDKEGREAGTITMRIPKDKFLTALESLSQLGKVEDSRTDSKDVAQEYASVKSHLDAAMVVYTKMLEALQKKQVTIPDAIRLESELTPVLKRVEDLKNQLEALHNAVSFTTVNVYFHEPAVSAKVLQYSKQTIAEGMLSAKINAVRSLAGAIPFLSGALVVIVVIVAALVSVAALVQLIIGKFFKKR